MISYVIHKYDFINDFNCVLTMINGCTLSTLRLKGKTEDRGER